MKVLIITLILSCCRLAFATDVVVDPIEDFLHLPTPGRYGDASQVVEVQKVTVDLEGTGEKIIFVGHPHMWNGGDDYYVAAYKRTEKGFQRLTAEDAEIGVDFYDGYGDRVYVGWIDEMRSQGMVIVDPIWEGRRHSDRSPYRIFPRARFFIIKDGMLKVIERGKLDLKKAVDQRFYKRYFSTIGGSRGLEVEYYTVNKLKEMGYKIPDWTIEPKTEPKKKAK